MAEIKVILGDITNLDVDVIVNAAKSSLKGGSGVDGAIHSKAGSELLAECLNIGGCMTGDAKITKGYNLKSKHIIHTVRPVWQDDKSGERESLIQCYTNSLILAEENNLKKIAFPCISTGAYGFPYKIAAKIALDTIKNFSYKSIEEITFCCYENRDYEEYQKVLKGNFLKKLFK